MVHAATVIPSFYCIAISGVHGPLLFRSQNLYIICKCQPSLSIFLIFFNHFCISITKVGWGSPVRRVPLHPGLVSVVVCIACRGQQYWWQGGGGGSYYPPPLVHPCWSPPLSPGAVSFTRVIKITNFSSRTWQPAHWKCQRNFAKVVHL